MNVQIRPLIPDDISRVSVIERQAFPTVWPPTPFKRELDNRLAKYLVAWEPKRPETRPVEPPGLSPEPSKELVNTSSGSVISRLVGAVKGHLSPTKAPAGGLGPLGVDYSIQGFVGLWFMLEEAHITAIAVEEVSRGKGVGELLLIGSIELAMSRGATVVSLEARVSNYVAQSLYEKYGFQKMGIRKGYYTDNREDAAIMTTEPINTPTHQETFQALTEAYRQRYGEIRIVLS